MIEAMTVVALITATLTCLVALIVIVSYAKDFAQLTAQLVLCASEVNLLTAQILSGRKKTEANRAEDKQIRDNGEPAD